MDLASTATKTCQGCVKYFGNLADYDDTESEKKNDTKRRADVSVGVTSTSTGRKIFQMLAQIGNHPTVVGYIQRSTCTPNRLHQQARKKKLKGK